MVFLAKAERPPFKKQKISRSSWSAVVKRTAGGPGDGADDYICKPFRKRGALGPRQNACCAGKSSGRSRNGLRFGALVLDFGSYTANLNKKELNLTPKSLNC